MPLELMPLIQRYARRRLVRRGARSRTVTVGGNDVHLVDLPGSGSAPPILILHGLGSSSLAFAPVIPALARLSRRVLAADLPGAGFSPLPHQPPTIEASVRLLASLYERELAGERAIVFGNSLGGAMAASLAIERPDLVRALVLSAPAGAQVAPGRFREMVQQFELRSWREGRDFVRRLYHKPPPLVPELLAFDMISNFARPHVKVLLHGERPGDSLEPEKLRALAMPVLLLWGRSERILPYEGVEFFRANLPPHAVVEELEGWGHVPHLDRPRELVERISRFVRELPAG